MCKSGLPHLEHFLITPESRCNQEAGSFCPAFDLGVLEAVPGPKSTCFQGRRKCSGPVPATYVPLFSGTPFPSLAKQQVSSSLAFRVTQVALVARRRSLVWQPTVRADGVRSHLPCPAGLHPCSLSSRVLSGEKPKRWPGTETCLLEKVCKVTQRMVTVLQATWVGLGPGTCSGTSWPFIGCPCRWLLSAELWVRLRALPFSHPGDPFSRPGEREDVERPGEARAQAVPPLNPTFPWGPWGLIPAHNEGKLRGAGVSQFPPG